MTKLLNKKPLESQADNDRAAVVLNVFFFFELLKVVEETLCESKG
jgi:hypothetical protein